MMRSWRHNVGFKCGQGHRLAVFWRPPHETRGPPVLYWQPWSPVSTRAGAPNPVPLLSLPEGGSGPHGWDQPWEPGGSRGLVPLCWRAPKVGTDSPRRTERSQQLPTGPGRKHGSEQEGRRPHSAADTSPRHGGADSAVVRAQLAVSSWGSPAATGLCSRLRIPEAEPRGEGCPAAGKGGQARCAGSARRQAASRTRPSEGHGHASSPATRRPHAPHSPRLHSRRTSHHVARSWGRDGRSLARCRVHTVLDPTGPTGPACPHCPRVQMVPLCLSKCPASSQACRRHRPLLTRSVPVWRSHLPSRLQRVPRLPRSPPPARPLQGPHCGDSRGYGPAGSLEGGLLQVAGPWSGGNKLPWPDLGEMCTFLGSISRVPAPPPRPLPHARPHPANSCLTPLTRRVRPSRSPGWLLEAWSPGLSGSPHF